MNEVLSLTPENALIQAVQNDTSGGGFFAAFLIVIIIAVPLLLRFFNWSKQNNAQGLLYEQLSEQLKDYKKEVDKLYDDRRKLEDDVSRLRHKVESLESCEQTIVILKQKLDYKDEIIAQRDMRISNLLEELLEMKDRVHNLELRLKTDELNWCRTCQYAPADVREKGVVDE